MVIYKITNLVNGKIYIGQTVQCLNKRWKQHCRKNSHCLYLKNAIQKYGKENFKIEVLENCSFFDEMEEKEKQHILDNNCIFPNGYNLTTGSKNYRHNSDTKKKMSQSARGKRHTKETKEKLSVYWKNKRKGKNNSLFKPIVCLNTGVIYESQREAAEKLGIQQPNICKVLSGARTHTAGFKFKFVEE